ncbi:hypothetical protein EJB05_03243 [Eragrostis curvula]|uniref:Uncharacterized protein n=1 Tax=Eragrostis curvula TaxID=38414 RepID=A0A5J9WUD3_9POAL|nr:hypothetical protein EJB05_03243 [Eragrostis curvula]
MLPWTTPGQLQCLPAAITRPGRPLAYQAMAVVFLRGCRQRSVCDGWIVDSPSTLLRLPRQNHDAPSANCACAVSICAGMMVCCSAEAYSGSTFAQLIHDLVHHSILDVVAFRQGNFQFKAENI